MVVRAGRFRHRVTVQQPDGSADDHGERTQAWVSFGTAGRWAAIEPLSGRELVVAAQVDPQLSVVIRMRFTPGITTQMRVLIHDNRILNIGYIVNRDERNRELDLFCTEEAL